MFQNLKHYFIAKGYDLVSYFDEKPKEGNPKIFVTLDGAKYCFVSQENMKKFIANPKKYIPLYGGFCAIAMTEGSTVDAHPTAYLIQDGKLLLFYASKFKIIEDTRRQWKKDPERFIKIADKVYADMQKGKISKEAIL